MYLLQIYPSGTPLSGVIGDPPGLSMREPFELLPWSVLNIFS
jgi:hypothetical protein